MACSCSQLPFLGAKVFEAVEAYKLLLAQPDEKIDLLKAASLVACHRYPLLDHELLVDQLDDLAVQVEGTLPAGAPRYPLRTLQAISQHLYQTLGFRGNKEDYYSPDNSCINRVLELRTGIPITLALVYMEVARRVGLPMLGVNIPGHFFITPSLEGTEFLVDPFQGGEISFLQDVESTLEGIYGNPVKLPPQLLENKHPLPARVFLARMLNNLKQVYMIQEDYASAYTISTYQQATRPMDPDIVRDAGLFLYYLGRIPECRETLTRYLQMCPPDAEDADKIRRLLERLSQQQ
ncbi:hypothetical protein N2152v2_008710 [Parachlorella kessleri]